MDPAERELLEYEQECYSQIRSKLLWAGEVLPVYGRTILEVGLRGWAKETEIVIRYLENGATMEKSWGLWRGDLVIEAGETQSPSGIGAMIYAIMTEPS